MLATSNLSAKPSPFFEPEVAPCRLWQALEKNQPVTDLAATSPVEALDRLPLSLPGRCLTPDGVHVVCEAVGVTRRGLTVACEVDVQPGESIVANFRGLGEISGVVEHIEDGWFVLDLRESPERIAALSKALHWAVQSGTKGAAERRSSVRIDQNLRHATLKSTDGRETPVEMIDMSTTGAALRLGAASPYFWVGQEVALDGRPGRVRRNFTGGVGIEFDTPGMVEEPL